MLTTALQFSGGKDSLACLHLWEDMLDETVVLWVNTGAAYPETIRQMERVAARVPHFKEVRTDQPANIEQYGLPADVVPTINTSWGRLSTSEPGPKIQSYIDCCAGNIWIPMHNAVREMGLTRIVRGQRNDERRTSPIRSGQIVDGIEYVFPLQDWSREQVMEYLRNVGADIPGYYEHEQTSRDCWSCTAYLDESRDRIRRLPSELREVVMMRIRGIHKAVQAEMKPLEDLT